MWYNKYNEKDKIVPNNDIIVQFWGTRKDKEFCKVVESGRKLQKISLIAKTLGNILNFAFSMSFTYSVHKHVSYPNNLPAFSNPVIPCVLYESLSVMYP